MANEIFYVKKDNRLPRLERTLQDANGAAINLTGATVRLHQKAPGASTPKIDQPATVDDAVNGKVGYDWAAADVDTLGFYHDEWEVIFASGKKQNFPNDRKGFLVIITDKLA